MMFFILMFGVIITGKMCAKIESGLKDKTPEQELIEKSGMAPNKDWQIEFCENQNKYVMNIGVIVLVLGAGKKVLQKKSKNN